MSGIYIKEGSSILVGRDGDQEKYSVKDVGRFRLKVQQEVPEFCSLKC